MAGTSEGGRKAAAHQDMAAKGRKGAQALNSNPEKKSAASRKAASHQDMSAKGRKGGQSSRSGRDQD